MLQALHCRKEVPTQQLIVWPFRLDNTDLNLTPFQFMPIEFNFKGISKSNSCKCQTNTHSMSRSAEVMSDALKRAPKCSTQLNLIATKLIHGRSGLNHRVSMTAANHCVTSDLKLNTDLVINNLEIMR